MQTNLALNGPSGNIEAIYHMVNQDVTNCCIICHPHPLHQGTMHNKVITTTAKSFAALGIDSIRFNYRGVGKSDGEYANAEGEVEDCLAVVNWLQTQHPNIKIHLAGFSFGAYIAACCAEKIKTEQLLCIAPVVTNYNFATHFTCPINIIVAEKDELINPKSIEDWFLNINSKASITIIEGSSHFFHGKLLKLQQVITEYYQ